MEYNPEGNPYNSGNIIDDRGEMKLLPKDVPWVPVEPWEPGNLGIPVCDGPNGSKVALIICHDGMFPEMARECAYKGANIMLRTAGYTAPIRHSWHVSNQSDAFCNLMYTANVCMAGTDGVFNSMGEGMIVNFDGVPLVTGNGAPDEIITAEVRPKLADEARQLGRRKQHLSIRSSRLRCGSWRRTGLSLHLHERFDGRQISATLGGCRAGYRWIELWLCDPQPDLSRIKPSRSQCSALRRNPRRHPSWWWLA